jgi:hypothetical protein
MQYPQVFLLGPNILLSTLFSNEGHDRSLGIATRLRAGRAGFDSRQGLEIFLFATVSRPALGPTQPSIQWVPGALSLGVKRLGREADHSSPSNAEVKKAWIYTLHSPKMSSWRGAYLSTRTTLPSPYLSIFQLSIYYNNMK